MKKINVKSFLAVLGTVLLTAFLCSCSGVREDGSADVEKYTMSENSTVYTIDPTVYLDLGDIDMQSSDILAYSGSNIFISAADFDNNRPDIFLCNTENNNISNIGTVDWQAMYHHLYTVIGDRYFVIIPSTYETDGVKSTVYVYDIQTQSFYVGDEFHAAGIEQYIANISNERLAYFYLEEGTGDGVIRIYDFEENTSSEVYRCAIKDNGYYPAALCSEVNKLLPVLQRYDEDLQAETLIREIDLEGNELKEYNLTAFDVDEIRYMKYMDGCYYIGGCNVRAIVDGGAFYEDKAVIACIGDSITDNYQVISPSKALLSYPLNYTNNPAEGLQMFFSSSGNYTDFNEIDAVAIDTDTRKIAYISINIPDCPYIYAARSNENGDLAVIKYSDENYTECKLALVKSESIAEGIGIGIE